jgi:hypothetical protein
MYTQFKVDRGRKDHWAMYPCPKKIKVVREDEDEKARNGRKTVKQVFGTILVRERPAFFVYPKGGPGSTVFGPPILSKIPYQNGIADPGRSNRAVNWAFDQPLLAGSPPAPPREKEEFDLHALNDADRVGPVVVNDPVGVQGLARLGNIINSVPYERPHRRSPRYLKHPPSYIRPDPDFPFVSGLTPAGTIAPDLGFHLPTMGLVVEKKMVLPSLNFIVEDLSSISVPPSPATTASSTTSSPTRPA